MITNENLAHRSSARHPQPLGTGADSFKRVLGCAPKVTSSGPAIAAEVNDAYFFPNRSPTLIGIDTYETPFTVTTVTLPSRKTRVFPVLTL